ncbi:MAG TPA: site-specific integrase [Polyangiaceae bacterium]|jgi:integrase
MPVYPGRRAGTHRVTVFHGRQHEWIVEGTKRDARDFEAKQRAELAAGERLAKKRSVPRFSEFCEEAYAPHARASLGASTWANRMYPMATLVEHFGALRMDESWTLERVDAYKRARTRVGIRPGTVNKELAILKTILAFARREHGLDVPKLKIARLKVPKRRVQVWSREEVRMLYAAASKWDPRLAPLLHFLFDTGCRKGELIAAEWSWVEWETALLRIPATEGWKPKNGEPREVPLSTALLVTLRGLPRNESSPAIFNSDLGRAFGTFPEADWRVVRDKSGVSGAIHVTRHTFASHFLKVRPDLALLAQVLGHSTAYVTEIYGHLLPEHLERARDVVSFAPPGKGWAKGESLRTLAAALVEPRRRTRPV